MSINLFDLTGKTALVVGASRGIGHAIATGLHYAGARTTGCGRSKKDDKVSGFYEFRYEQCDVMNLKRFDELCADIAALDPAQQRLTRN